MESQKEPAAFQTSSQNINIKISAKDFSKTAYFIFHISNFTALLSSILLILTYGTGSPFQTVRYLFASLTSISHVSSIVIFMCDFSTTSKKDENYSTTSLITDMNNRSILNKFILCTDVHDLTILLLFSYAGITPILYVFCYIISFSLNFLNCTLTDILPLLGSICSPQNLPQDPNAVPEESTEKRSDLLSALDPAKKMSNSMVIKVLPVVFQMIIVFQLFIITLFDISIFTLFMLAVYIAWEVMFDYATNAIYHDVWSKIRNKINESAEANMTTYGNILSILVNGFSKIGQLATKWYK